MRYAGILKNDFVNGEGVCVSFWTQGCPHRCPGCHNPQTWDFNGGKVASIHHIIVELKSAITKNGIQRNFSILGGEPLCPENRINIAIIIEELLLTFPGLKIFLWTGYTDEELANMHDTDIDFILSVCDVYVTGRFIQEQRDITNKWYGSSNQKVHINENNG